jgi:hypothetical protein
MSLTAALMWHVGGFGPVRHQLNQFLADTFLTIKKVDSTELS